MPLPLLWTRSPDFSKSTCLFAVALPTHPAPQPVLRAPTSLSASARPRPESPARGDSFPAHRWYTCHAAAQHCSTRGEEAEAEADEDRSVQARSHFPAPPLAADNACRSHHSSRCGREWQTEEVPGSEPERRPHGSGCSADTNQGKGTWWLEGE